MLFITTSSFHDADIHSSHNGNLIRTLSGDLVEVTTSYAPLCDIPPMSWVLTNFKRIFGVWFSLHRLWLSHKLDRDLYYTQVGPISIPLSSTPFITLTQPFRQKYPGHITWRDNLWSQTRTHHFSIRYLLIDPARRTDSFSSTIFAVCIRSFFWPRQCELCRSIVAHTFSPLTIYQWSDEWYRNPSTFHLKRSVARLKLANQQFFLGWFCSRKLFDSIWNMEPVQRQGTFRIGDID